MSQPILKYVCTGVTGAPRDRMIAFSEFAALAMHCDAISCEEVIKDLRGSLHSAWREQNGVSNGDLGWITNFIWGIADDVLRDLYVRGKYRDVILPMTVLRRLDAVLEPTKEGGPRDEGRASTRPGSPTRMPHFGRPRVRPSTTRRASPCAICAPAQASSSSRPTSRPISTASRRTCRRSSTSFEFRNQIPRLSKADALGTLIEKFLDPSINLGPDPVLNGDGSVKHPGPRQPRDGHDLRGAGSPLQRGEQRRGRRALDAARRRQADGEARSSADRRPDRVGHLSAL